MGWNNSVGKLLPTIWAIQGMKLGGGRVFPHPSRGPPSN